MYQEAAEHSHDLKNRTVALQRINELTAYNIRPAEKKVVEEK